MIAILASLDEEVCNNLPMIIRIHEPDNTEDITAFTEDTQVFRDNNNNDIMYFNINIFVQLEISLGLSIFQLIQDETYVI